MKDSAKKRVRWTRQQMEQCIDSLYTFAREQGYQVTALGPGRGGRHHYLAQHADNVVEVSLTNTGSVLLSTEQGMGNQGRISPTLLSWCEQEGLLCTSDQPFSRHACVYLTGSSAAFSVHTPQRAAPERRSSAGVGGRTIRQLIPSSPGWFAVYATVHPPEGDVGFELFPLVGWALVDDDSWSKVTVPREIAPSVVALWVWGHVERESMPDARPRWVDDDRTGFLGYQFPGCTTDWAAEAAWFLASAYDEEAEAWKA